LVRSFAAVAGSAPVMAGVWPPTGSSAGDAPRPSVPGISSAGTRPPVQAPSTGRPPAPVPVPALQLHAGGSLPGRVAMPVQFGMSMPPPTRPL
jgi:hypothetical protein